MPLTASFVEQVLRERIADASEVQVVDESGGCGAKFACLVVADSFDGVSRLQRHRAVQQALAEEMSDIHALSIKAQTSAERAKDVSGAAASSSSS